MAKMNIRRKNPAAKFSVTGDHLTLLKDCREMLRESKPDKTISNSDIMRMIIELAHLALVTTRKLAEKNAEVSPEEEAECLS